MTNDKEEFFRQFYQSADLEYVDYRGSNVYQIADIELKEAFKTVESKLKAKDEEIESLKELLKQDTKTLRMELRVENLGLSNTSD